MNSKTGLLYNSRNVILYLTVLLSVSLNLITQSLDLWHKRGMTQFDFFLIILEVFALYSLLRSISQIAQTHRLPAQTLGWPNNDNPAMRAVTRLGKGQSLAQLGDWEAEQAVHQQQALLRQVIDSIPHHLFVRDRTGRFCLANRAAAAVHGTTPEQLVGHHEADFNPHLDADWLAQVTAINREVMEKQQIRKLPDTQLISHTGQIHWCQVHLSPYFDVNGQVCGIIGNTLDVTDRKQLELALQASEARLQAILNSSPYGIFLKDLQGSYTYVNPAYEQMSQLSAAELLGKSDYDTLPQTFAAIREGSDHKALVAAEPIIFEENLPWQDGTQTLLVTKFALRELNNGPPYAVCGIVLNITKRKEMETALRESQRQYETLVNSVDSIVWEADPETFQFTFVSPQAERLLGYPLTEWLEPNFWLDHILPEDLDAVCDYCQRSIERGQDHRFEYRMLTADGRIIWIQDIVKLVFEGPRLVKLVGLLLDISDRKRAEQELVTLATQERAFNRVVHTIRSSLDLDTIFATTAREAASLLDIGRVGIVQYLAERQCWIPRVEYRSHPEVPNTVGFEIPDTNNPFSEQLKRFEVVQIDSTKVISDSVNRAFSDQFPGAWLLIPLVVNDQLWGSLSFLKDPSISPFSKNQVAMAERFANQLAIAIQQSTLYTQLQAANQKLQYLATHDPLTEVANRRYFDDYLERECSRLHRSQECIWLSLILCDIDYFKQYNDYYGHPQGDDCLIRVAQSISRGIKRSVDFVARFGGEEFAIVLPETDEAGAVYMVKQIQAEVADLNLRHASSPVSSQVTLSFGVACVHKQKPEFSQTPQSLLQIADEALYKAKRSGRNQYQITVAGA